jgi:hypothetical protein
VAAPEPFSAPEPISVEPSRNDTVPVGIPVPGARTVTVAVNVTAWLTPDGFAEEATAVDVGAWPTTCESAGDELLPPKVVSPPYDAVIECIPAVVKAAKTVATPELFSTPAPICVDPSRNATVPVGTKVPDDGCTVAVKVTDCPTIEGLTEEIRVVVAPVVPLELTLCKNSEEFAGAKVESPL